MVLSTYGRNKDFIKKNMPSLKYDKNSLNEFTLLLEKVSNNFVEWRYYYEDDIIGCFATGDAYCDLDKLKENAKTYGINATIAAVKAEMQRLNYTCTD